MHAHTCRSDTTIRKRLLYEPAQISRFINVTITRRLKEDFVKGNMCEKFFGAVDTRRYPNRVWSEQGDHEERGSNDRAASTYGQTVARSMIRADASVSIVPHTISGHLAEANLKSKRPFRALQLTPEHRQLRL
ncbi:hypothetical protein TNCV_4628471 [Trichonephila clavipes]|nr:hypothetical protein TNCV_4628471 [Trichonephila clavipes]